jgi:alkylation response protein AidB-like acyl-CoA dehydrogenase
MNIDRLDAGGLAIDGRIPVVADILARFDASLSPSEVPSLIDAARETAERAFARAGDYDEDGAFPVADVAALRDRGLLSATLPIQHGGGGIGPSELFELLRRIGWGSLPLGRLFEGHVNAIRLALTYGDDPQIRRLAREAEGGMLFGVWNTDDRDGLRLVAEKGRHRLVGRKILASGAGFIERPLVTATDEAGRRLMVMPRLGAGERSDLSGWTAQGMRASATGAVDFTGIVVEADEIIGGDGDYERQPGFSGGAWRFAAVHLGGIERLFDLLREHLRRTGRGGDPHQAARLGQAASAAETARLWVERAAAIAEGPARAPERIVAYVNLARMAVERSGLELMELVHRSVGLPAFVRPNPIERVSRDLATYLRQPGPDRALTGAADWVLRRGVSSLDLWSGP